MCQVMVTVPNEVLYDTHMNITDATAFARKMVALGYYTRNNVSIGYCAEIAGLSEEKFMAFLADNHIDIYAALMAVTKDYRILPYRSRVSVKPKDPKRYIVQMAKTVALLCLWK